MRTEELAGWTYGGGGSAALDFYYEKEIKQTEGRDGRREQGGRHTDTPHGEGFFLRGSFVVKFFLRGFAATCIPHVSTWNVSIMSESNFPSSLQFPSAFYEGGKPTADFRNTQRSPRTEWLGGRGWPRASRRR